MEDPKGLPVFMVVIKIVAKKQENTCNPNSFMIEFKCCDDKKRWSSDTEGI